MATITTERVPTPGGETHLLRAGAGNPGCVLLLHGGGPGAGAEANWTPTLATLGEVVDVLAPDLVGFGSTTHPDPPVYGPQAWLDLRVEQLLGLMDHVGAEQADLVGNSLGGALSLRFAIAHPDRVRRLVLMGSAGPPTKPSPDLLRLLNFYSDPTTRNLEELLRSFVYDLEQFGDVGPLVEQRLQAALDPVSRRSFDAMFHAEDGEFLKELSIDEESIKAIGHPTLIVHGREDRIIPMAASLWLLHRIRGADLHVIGRCGHWAMLEHPQTFARLVRTFLQLDRQETTV